MGSRLRENPEKIFEVFVEVGRVAGSDGSSTVPFILQKYPDKYADPEVLKSVPGFALPCETESSNVDHFTFVLTDLEGKFKFGFCRQGMGAQTSLCIISYLPWFEVFYKLLNHVAEILNRSDDSNTTRLLASLYNHKIPEEPEGTISLVTAGRIDVFSCTIPDPTQLLSIPTSRNLTEYYNAVDPANMMIIFASMLYERRILITSRKLSRLTACVHASTALLLPMHWQHLYIPVLPTHLVDYCSAPMPFVIGVHSSLMPKVQAMELGDAVILDADNNTVTSQYEDLETLPPDIVSHLKKRLKAHQSDKLKSSFIGDGVSRTFLKALAALIGGYRDALKFRPGEQITFDEEAFIQSRPQNMQAFLEKLPQLQIFEQFINDRLDMLNAGQGFSDEFEMEANLFADHRNTQSHYKEWVTNMKRQGKKLTGKAGVRWDQFTSRVKVKKKKVPTATLR